METRVGEYLETCHSKVWCGEVEEDRELEVLAGQIDWSDIHANSKAVGTAVIS